MRPDPIRIVVAMALFMAALMLLPRFGLDQRSVQWALLVGSIIGAIPVATPVPSNHDEDMSGEGQ